MPLDFFERIDAHFHKNLPFVVYRKPKAQTVKAIFQKDDQVHPLKTYAETGFVFAPFDARHPTLLLHPDELLETSAAELSPDTNTIPTAPARPIRHESGKASHIRLIKEVIGEIEKGTFKKVVLSRRIEIDTEASPLNLFRKLLANYPEALCYLWYHPKVGLWLGATPEILMMLRNRQLTTMSLAGTQNYIGNEHLRWGQKEQEEQQMVTDYITDALKDKVDRLNCSDTETVRAGNLLHLRTKITAHVAEDDLGAIVHRLHPTPAVCGMPKESAQGFILDNENYDREYYTGFLGELNLKTEKQRNERRKNQENQAYRSISKTTTLYVNLRCMQLKDNQAFIYVGGGITNGSDADREWEETVAKSDTMLSIFN